MKPKILFAGIIISLIIPLFFVLNLFFLSSCQSTELQSAQKIIAEPVKPLFNNLTATINNNSYNNTFIKQKPVEEVTKEVAEKSLVNSTVKLNIDLNRVKSWAYFINFQDEAKDIKEIADSTYDLVVIDNSRTLKGNEKYDSKKDVQTLKNSRNSFTDNSFNAGKKIVLSYMELGEAEEYRWYWQNNWRIGNPSFIAIENPEGWSGNYPVLYWDPAWKKIVFEYLDKIIQDGYDGVYLDWVEAYSDEKIAKFAKKAGKNAKQEIVNFVKEIANYSRQKKPSFLVVAQNAAELGSIKEYLETIDAVAQEHVWFDGTASSKEEAEKEGDCAMPAKPGEQQSGNPAFCEGLFTLLTSSKERIDELMVFRAAGKPVFTIDYAQKKENIAKAYGEAKKYGFKEYVTVRSLSKLS